MAKTSVRFSQRHLSITSIATVIFLLAFGLWTSSPIATPLLLLAILLTGAFLLSGVEMSSIERMILLPAVGLSFFALSSLLMPLVSELGFIKDSVHSDIVVASAAILPILISMGYWKTGSTTKTFRVQFSPRLVIPIIPVLLGAGGAIVQRETGIVFQNYLVMGFLTIAAPIFLYWAESEFEVAASLYGIAIGVILSHSLVTGYAVGVDNQMSLHAVDQILQSGTWPIRDIYFRPGAETVPLSSLINYVGSELSHTGLPVIVGITILFNTVGNIPADAVFDIVFVGLFSLTPVAIYRIGREQLSVNEAFVAGMLLIVYYRFFHTSPGKQHMAQFFLAALLVWLILSGFSKKEVITLFLITGIIFSHYAVTFLFMGFLIGGYLISRWYTATQLRSQLSIIFVGLFYCYTTIWYIIIRGGKKPIQAISAVARSIQVVLTTNSAQSRTGASIASEKIYLVDQVNLLLHGLLFGAISLGILALAYYAIKTRKPVFSVEIDSLSFCFFGLLAASMVISGHLGIDRALDIGLILLGPIAVFGVKRSFALIGKGLPLNLEKKTYHLGIIFVVVMMFFSSGLAYQAAGNPATSAINLQETPNSVMFIDDEYDAAKWTASHRNDSLVYVNSYSSTTFTRVDGRSPSYLRNIKDYRNNIAINWSRGGYVFIRKSAITNRSSRPIPHYEIEYDRYKSIRNRGEIVYENSAAVVLRITPTDND